MHIRISISEIENRACRFRIFILYLFSRHINSHASIYVSYMLKKKTISIQFSANMYCRFPYVSQYELNPATRTLLIPIGARFSIILFYTPYSKYLPAQGLTLIKYFYVCTPRLSQPLSIFTNQNIHSSTARFV